MKFLKNVLRNCGYYHSSKTVTYLDIAIHSALQLQSTKPYFLRKKILINSIIENIFFKRRFLCFLHWKVIITFLTFCNNINLIVCIKQTAYNLFYLLKTKMFLSDFSSLQETDYITESLEHICIKKDCSAFLSLSESVSF